MNSKHFFILLLYIFLNTCFLLTQCMADEFHFKSLFAGDRPAGFAGAYTAVSDDVSGLYYNPAGIVFGQEQASASLNAYVRSSTRYESVLGDMTYTRQSGEIVPGLLGGTYTFYDRKLMLGFSVCVEDAEIVEQDARIFNMVYEGIPWFDEANIHHKMEYRVYDIGPSAGLKITENFSVGTTLYIYWKEKNEDFSQKFTYYLDGLTEFDVTNVFIDESEWGLKPIVGMTWKIHPRLTAGLTCSRIFLLNRDYEYEYTQHYYYGEAEEGFFEYYDLREISDAKREYPWTFTLGLAVKPLDSLVVSGDLSYYTRTDRKDENNTPSTFATRAFTNMALGLEYKLSEIWTLRTGFYTNKANAGMGDLAFDERRESIDMRGGAVGVTYKKEKIIISAGGFYSRGTGEASLGDFGFGDNVWYALTVDAKKTLWGLMLSISK